MNKIRILHIFSGYGGGISTLIQNLIENRTEDVICDTLAFSYSKGSRFVETVEKSRGQCLILPRPRVDGYETFIGKINSVFKNNKYDVIHCHIAGWRAMPFRSVAKKNHINTFIIHAHTSLYDSKIDRIPIVNKLDRCINYNISNNYMTCSDLAANYIFGKKYLAKRHAMLIPNGIDERLFVSEINNDEINKYRKEFKLEPNNKIILHVGRFSHPKNHEFILKVINKCVEDKQNFIFLFAGDGELFEDIKWQSNKMGIGKFVRFLGRRSDISKLMQFADIMILPSYYEGLPTVAVECQAAGTFMIVADTITRQCDMGLKLISFKPITDPCIWVETLKQTTYESMSAELCLQKIEENGFTAKKAGEMYTKVLRNMINENRG